MVLGTAVKPSYCVWIIAPPGNPHWQALNEVAEGIFYALKKLGNGVHIYAGAALPPFDYDRLIVFNSHSLHPSIELPRDVIIFNAEQVPTTDSSPAIWWAPYFARMKKHAVWDYSETNRERLKERGISSILCPVGYHPKLERIPIGDREDIDILFYGSPNARREKILEECRGAGLNVKHLFGVYGDERDAIIARSKIIVNIHFYPNPIWEIFRCSYLIANKKCVISEDGGCDQDLEKLAGEITVHVPYEKIVAHCKEFIFSESSLEQRQLLANVAYDIFSEQDQIQYVKAALKLSRSYNKENGSAAHG
jgi:hypothetical protein